MTRQSGTRLTVQATLLSDPPLWCWEIVDATSGALVESSWEGRWEAYASPGEALRHAAPALQRLSREPRLDAVPGSDDRPARGRAPVTGIRHTR